MEYTAVRYPTKEYRQYRPGSKGLNVHYRAFREQFYGNKAIIKHSFRDIHRNPSVGQYTDQRGIPTYAYKIPNGKMYKTAPLMDRIPRGGSVPRVVGSLGDVQGPEFFTEGSYQPLAAAGQTLNSPFLFGKASQELQDATAQYQAQTGKPVNAAVIKSKEFTDFYSTFIQNRIASEDSYLQRFQNDFQKPDEISNVEDELTLVNPAMNTDQSTQPAPDTMDTPMGNTAESEGLLTQAVGHVSNFLFNTRWPNNLTGEQPVDKNTAQSTTNDPQNVNDAGNYKDMPVDRISGANQNTLISNPGPIQVSQTNVANTAESTLANQVMDRNTEQDIRGPKDKAVTDKDTEYRNARKLSIYKINQTTLEGKSEIDGYNMTDLKKKLTEKGLEFNKNSSKKELAKLLHSWYTMHKDYKDIRPEKVKLKRAKKVNNF